MLLASNWRTQKQRERWLIALSISLAQTLKCNRFWQNTSVISAEVSTWWTELQGKGSPPTYTLDKFRAQKCSFCTVFPCQICMGLHKIYSYALLTKREVKMAGYWPSSFFLRFYGLNTYFKYSVVFIFIYCYRFSPVIIVGSTSAFTWVQPWRINRRHPVVINGTNSSHAMSSLKWPFKLSQKKKEI